MFLTHNHAGHFLTLWHQWLCFLLRFYPTCSFCPETSAAEISVVDVAASSGVTKQHATHAWWYTVVGVVVRCFVGDSNGRTVSNFAMNCGAASLLDHQNCCCEGGVQRRGTGFLMFYKADCYCKCSGVYVSLQFWCVECLYYLCIYYFPYWLKKDRSNVNRFFFCIPRFGRCLSEKKTEKLEHLFFPRVRIQPYALWLASIPDLCHILSVKTKRPNYHKTMWPSASLEPCFYSHGIQLRQAVTWQP